MSDDFIRELKGDWQSQGGDAAPSLRRLRARRWTPHVILATEVVLSILAFGVGLWFAWGATHNAERRVILVLSAAILLLTAPVFGAIGVMIRRQSLLWHDETPQALLLTGQRRVEASLRAMRLGRWSLAVLAIFVCTLWIVEAVGFMDEREFLLFYTTVSSVVALVAWGWIAWRERQLRREREAYARLLTLMGINHDDAERP